MFCRSARVLRAFILLRWTTGGLHLTRNRIGVESHGSARFPPDILPGGIARAGAGHNIGKDQRVAMDGDHRQAVSGPVYVFDRKCSRGKTDGCSLGVALVLNCLSRDGL